MVQKQMKQPDVSDKAADVITLKFKLHHDQANTIQRALDKTKAAAPPVFLDTDLG